MPSLRRLNESKTGDGFITDKLRREINQVIKELRRTMDKDLIHPQGKEPCLLVDLINVLEAIPDTHPDREGFCAATLISVYTGGRVGAISNIKIRDINSLITLADDAPYPKYACTIELTSRKAPQSARHSVTVDGHIASPESGETDFCDPVYWIARHLKTKFNLDLLDFQRASFRKEHLNDDRLLFPWDKDALSIKMREFSERAGFEDKTFSFHSLRSGFLCSALMDAATKGKSIANVIDFTALVAEWKPYGKVQLGYIKETFKRTAVGNRLVTSINPYRPESGQAAARQEIVIDPSFNNSVTFHNLDGPLQSNWTSTSNMNYFHRNLNAAIREKHMRGPHQNRTEPVFDLEVKRYKHAYCEAYANARLKERVEEALDDLVEKTNSWINTVDYIRVSRLRECAFILTSLLACLKVC